LPAIIRTLEEQMLVTALARLSTCDVIMFVKRVDMTKTIGGDGWFPVITRLEADALLGCEVNRAI